MINHRRRWMVGHPSTQTLADLYTLFGADQPECDLCGDRDAQHICNRCGARCCGECSFTVKHNPVDNTYQSYYDCHEPTAQPITLCGHCYVREYVAWEKKWEAQA